MNLTASRTPRYLGREAVARLKPCTATKPVTGRRVSHAARELEGPPLWKLVVGILGLFVLIPLAALAGWAFFLAAFSLQ